MRNQSQLVLGVILVGLGVLFLFSTLFDIGIGAFCWPMLLILIGVWWIVRPQLVSSDRAVTMHLFGDVDREGVWPVRNEEFWTIFGDIDLDMTRADLPPGETRLHFYSVFGDFEMRVPAGVGVAVSASGIATDVTLGDRKRSSFLGDIQLKSPGYEQAERRIKLNCLTVFGDIEVKQPWYRAEDAHER